MKNTGVNVKLSHEEKDTIKKVAVENGYTLCGFIRVAAIQKLKEFSSNEK